MNYSLGFVLINDAGYGCKPRMLFHWMDFPTGRCSYVFRMFGIPVHLIFYSPLKNLHNADLIEATVKMAYDLENLINTSDLVWALLNFFLINFKLLIIF